MKTYLTLILLAGTLHAFGQDTAYYDSGSNKVASLDKSVYYDVMYRNTADTNRVEVKSFYSSYGTPRNEVNYSNYTKKIRDGKFKDWYYNGPLRSDIDYKNGKISGQLLTYWDNTKPKRIDHYENGKFMDGKCMTSSGKDTTHYNYETLPHFPGGEKKMVAFLSKQIKYPPQSKAAKIQGNVLVGFVVYEDGTIANVSVIKSVAADLDKEAMRVIKLMPKWVPAKQDGVPYSVYYQLPMGFRLP